MLGAVKPSFGHYRTFYPKCTVKGRTFYLEYRQVSRSYDLYKDDHNGRLLGKFSHGDFALLAILHQITGYQGDTLPPKYRRQMAEIEQKIGLKYQGLSEDE